ncbi:hypothetical protein [Polyangium aurulentum]|uniref:hypothetical protein n=1 Tax=Polyangium aurulentum TaxID=2567896 RepID=UPI0010AE4DAE|nr:hypothetical protein [Polyangium aurulentum]UQA62075.1 hypothetical protein E8A73_017000 [Polyangium aurulentum]
MVRAAAGATIVWLLIGLAASCGTYEIEEPTGSGGSGATGGSGGMVACTSDSDCKPTANPCRTPWCGENGFCTTTPITSDEEQKENALGDCKRHICKEGNLTAVEDAMDVPNDGNECTKDACNGTVPVIEVPAGSECGGGYCKAAFDTAICVECTTNEQCSGIVDKSCQRNKCVLPSCMNTIKDVDEADKDCGGSCGPCNIGQACSKGTDCDSGACTNGKCVEPTCSDKIPNGSETDVDCGGDCEAGCEDGSACRVADDCANGLCYVGKCQAAQCNDNVKNGTETGLDCGGNCEPCP